MLLESKIIIFEYKRKDGKSPFGKWLDSLDERAEAKVQTAVRRMREGNFSNAKPIGQGVSEFRLNFGPGYRIYFGRDGDRLVVLLGGGTKKGQRRDIETAKKLWVEYKARKKEGDVRWN